MASFPTAMAYVLSNEGTTYTDRPADHGGPTRYGITQRTLEQHRGSSVPPAAVADLCLVEAEAIYRQRYWGPVCGEVLASQLVATALLDVAVLCGPQAAVALAQGVAHVAPADGHMGPVTLAALGAASPHGFAPGYMAALQDRFAGIVVRAPSQVVFLRGWLMRSRRLLTLP